MIASSADFVEVNLFDRLVMHAASASANRRLRAIFYALFELGLINDFGVAEMTMRVFVRGLDARRVTDSGAVDLFETGFPTRHAK
jgi:hypothetical protein